MKRGKKKFWIFAGILVASLILFRHALLIAGTDLAFRFFFPGLSSLNYEKISWEDGKIIISEVRIKEKNYEFRSDLLECGFVFDWRHLYLEPHVLFLHPEIFLSEGQATETLRGSCKTPADFDVSSQSQQAGSAHANEIIPERVGEKARGESTSKGRFYGEREFCNCLLNPLFIIPSKHFGLKLEVQNGVLQLLSSSPERIYFKFEKGAERKDIGTLSMSYDPSSLASPFLWMEMKVQEQELMTYIQLQQAEGSKLSRWVSFFYPSFKERWQDVEGELELKSKVTFLLSSQCLNQISCQVDVRHCSFNDRILGLHTKIEELHADYSFPSSSFFSIEHEKKSFWETFAASVSIQGGEITLFHPSLVESCSLKDLNAHFLLLPSQEPSLGLKGNFFAGEKLFPLSIDGRGLLNQDESFWIEANIDFGSGSKQEDASLSCSFCTQDMKNFILQTDFQNINAGQIEVVKAFFTPLFPVLDTLEIQKGSFQGKATTTFQHADLVSIECHDCLSKEIYLTYRDKHSSFSADEIYAEGLMNVDHDGNWQIATAKSEAKNAHFNFETIGECSSLDIQVAIEDSLLQPSIITGDFFGFKGKIDILPEKEESLANIHLISNSRDILKRIFPTEKYVDLNVSVNIFSKLFKNDTGFEVAGEVFFEQEHRDKQTIIVNADIPRISSLVSVFEPTFLSSIRGWFRSEALSPWVYAPLASCISKEIKVEGEIDVFGTFDAKTFECSLQAEDLKLFHPRFNFFLNQLGEKDPFLLKTQDRAVFSYHFEDMKWQGEVPIKNGMLLELQKGLCFNEVCATCSFNENILTVKDIDFNLEGLNVKGEGSLSFDQDFKVAFTASSLKGPADALRVLAAKWFCPQEFPQAFEGSVLGGEKAVHFSANLTSSTPDLKWQTKFRIEDFGIQVAPEVKLDHMHFDVVADSEKEEGSITQLVGRLQGIKNSYPIWAQNIVLKNLVKPEVSFDLHIENASQEIFRLAGSGTFENDYFKVFLDPSKSHFWEQNIRTSQVLFDSKGSLFAFQIQTTLKAQQFAEELQFLSDCSLVSLSFATKEQIKAWEMEGALDTLVNYEQKSDTLSFSLHSEDFRAGSFPLENFKLKGEKIGNQWILDQICFNDLMLKGSFLPHAQGVQVPFFEVKWHDAYAKGQGDYQFQTQQFVADLKLLTANLAKIDHNWSLQGMLTSHGTLLCQFPTAEREAKVEGEIDLAIERFGPNALQIKNKNLLKFSFLPNAQLIVSNIDLQAKETHSEQVGGNIQIKELNYDMLEKAGSASQIFFFFSSPMVRSFAESGCWLKSLDLKEGVEGHADLTFSSNDFLLNGSLKDFSYFVFDQPIRFSHVQYTIRSTAMKASAKAVYQQVPVLALLNFDYSQQKKGELILRGSLDDLGLHVNFANNPKAGFFLSSIEGVLCGIDAWVNSNQEKGLYTGKIKLDLSKAQVFLPVEFQNKIKNMNFGKGYEIKGSLHINPNEPFAFVGELKGENFEIIGCTLKAMQGQVECSPDHILLRNMIIEDQAGHFSIKQIKCTKNLTKKRWMLDIPLVQAREVQPSLFKKQGQQKEIKPFIIKHFDLFNLKGWLDDPHTYKGHGRLDFTNQFKKGYNFFDVSLDIIKNIGLDPGLFTPIGGEIEYSLENGRFIIRELKNVYSEGRRSHFFLAPDKLPSYLTFDGRIHVDLKMKQNVMLKITEPFTLNVRGTIEKPEYSFER